MPFFLPLLYAAFFVASAAVIVFWEQVLGWAEKVITPWFEDHLPSLVPYLRNAYVGIDKAVVGVRRAAKKAWQEVRRVLLKQFVEYAQQPDGSWLVRLVSWLIGPDESRRTTKITSEQSVPYHDLPDAVRAEILKRGKTSHQVDLTELRDAQVLTNED
ncbi:hypothetical protein [Actinoplanes sp. GCM10030250]|uniref:hypothetical protein n=1 Tax=Actinoplanes sp. GCM10030250 TaxID=3273376 RepID=UPI003622F7FE